MRRALVIVMSTLLIGLGLGALATPTHAAPHSVRAAAESKSVTVNIEVVRRSTQFPSGNQTSYYCAVGAFVPFVDQNGWVPSEAAYVTTSATYGTVSEVATIKDSPYDDAAAIDIPGSGGAKLDFSAAPGTHHQQLGGYTYAQGPNPYDCQEEFDRYQSYYSDTAVVTYVRSQTCQAASEKVTQAQKSVSKAQQNVSSTQGAAHTAALTKLKAAKAKLAKAKMSYTKACT